MDRNLNSSCTNDTQVEDCDLKTHLQLIQGVIGRFSTITLSMKSLATTVTAGLIAVSVNSSMPQIAKLAVVAVVFYMIVDSYYSNRASLHWALYNQVAQGKTTSFEIFIDRGEDWLERLGTAFADIWFGLWKNPIILIYYGSLISVALILAKSISTSMIKN